MFLDAPHNNPAKPGTANDVPVGDLQLAVIAPDAALVRLPSGRLRLYAIADKAARCLGTFDDPGSAWAALDVLDGAA